MHQLNCRLSHTKDRPILAALGRLVAMSAGFTAPNTAFTINVHSETRSWSHSTRQLRCLSLPIPFPDSIPLAADESKYKHINM